MSVQGGGGPVDLGDAANTEKPTQGQRVRVGVARASFLDQLLRDQTIAEVLDDLVALDPKIEVAESGDILKDALARASAQVQLTDALRRSAVDRMSLIAAELQITWMGPWLVEFLVAAADFRRALKDLDLGACTLTDPSLSKARAYVRSFNAIPDPWSSERRRPPAIGLLASVIPDAEPVTWAATAPDWIELFAALVEHATERIDWTDDPRPQARLWLFGLSGPFVMHLQPGDDPEVLHGLVHLWAHSCHGLIDEHTETRIPRGQIPNRNGSYRDGRPREGGREKIRRWVGWYLDHEIRGIALNAILRASFPESPSALERSSELTRHIRTATGSWRR
jgi:hypothetical protein